MGTPDSQLNIPDGSLLFDECVPIWVVKGLRTLQIKPNIIHHFTEVGLGGVKDIPWFQLLTGKNICVFVNDRRILRNKPERSALLGSDIGIIVATTGAQSRFGNKPEKFFGTGIPS